MTYLVFIPLAIPLGLLLAILWIWFGRRPTAERFAAAQGLVIDDASLPLVRSALSRTYVGRIAGALIGGVGAGLLGWALGTFVAIPYLVLLGLVAGTMVGIALAQHRRRQAIEAVRRASLTARTVDEYAPEHATGWIAIAATACVGLPAMVALAAPAGLGAYAGVAVLAAAAVVVVPLGHVLQRRLVEAPRGDASPEVDDALRRTAVDAVHHAVLGVLCCGIVLAALTGTQALHTLDVVSDGHTVFRAPPGSISISSFTALDRLVDPNAPLRVSWTEADGSDHERLLPHVTGTFDTASSGRNGLGTLLGWLSLFVAVAAVVQWSRATRAWRRNGPSRRSVTSAIRMPGGPAGSAA